MKIICVGRNYRDHAKELNNPIPKFPILFMKPSTSLLVNDKPLYYPSFTEDLHFEAEIVLKVCKNGKHVQPEFASTYYNEIAFGIDFTARDIQQELKKKGHPWELAKAFDSSAAVSPFISISEVQKEAIKFHMEVNGKVAQKGNTKDLIFSFDYLICYISQYFRLQEGDYIFTGTPAGVGPIRIEDTLTGFIEKNHVLTCEIK